MNQTYRVRSLVPYSDTWHQISASSPAEAAQLLQADNRLPEIKYVIYKPDGRREVAHFTQVEIEGHGKLISRCFSSGITRKGVRPMQMSLEELAVQIGYEDSPSTLIEPWEGEESYEEARERARCNRRRP